MAERWQNLLFGWKSERIKLTERIWFRFHEFIQFLNIGNGLDESLFVNTTDNIQNKLKEISCNKKF